MFDLPLRGAFQRRTTLASHHRQLSVVVRDVYLSSSMLLFTYLFDESTRYQTTKKPLYSGASIIAYSPHLAVYSAGISTLPAPMQQGCWVSSGRVPPPLWMRANLIMSIEL